LRFVYRKKLKRSRQEPDNKTAPDASTPGAATGGKQNEEIHLHIASRALNGG
jgi:hypothetical protein